MFELLLVRHGQTDWNIERRVMGAKPISLNTTGRAQARAIAKGLKEIELAAVYTSPIKRAIQTARPILKGRDSISLFEEPGLAEIDYGDWVDRNFKDIPELEGYFQKPSSVIIPNGESLAGVQKRALEAVERMRVRHDGGRVMAISHADVIKLIVIGYLGLSIDDMNRFRLDNGSMTVFHFNDIKQPRLITHNTLSDWGRYCHK